MQILFGRLGAERGKIILLKFALYIDEIGVDLFSFKETGCICTSSNAWLIVAAQSMCRVLYGSESHLLLFDFTACQISMDATKVPHN